MPQFAANLHYLFSELPFLDRFEAAAVAGFKAVEFLFPYEYQAKEIVERVQANRLEVVLFNAPPGDWNAGERGLASQPGREHEFSASIATALRYAQALRTTRVHVMAGLVPDGAEVDEWQRRRRSFAARTGVGKYRRSEPRRRH